MRTHVAGVDDGMGTEGGMIGPARVVRRHRVEPPDGCCAVRLFTSPGGMCLVMTHPAELLGTGARPPVRWREIAVTSSPVHVALLTVTCKWERTICGGLSGDANSPAALRLGAAAARTCILLSDMLALRILGADAETCRVLESNLAHAPADQAAFQTVAMDERVRAVIAALAEHSPRGTLCDVYRSAKFAELLCLIAPPAPLGAAGDASTIRLSSRDVRMLFALKDFLAERSAGCLTLSQLAARFGLNRSKLAHGFKLLFGVTVMAYRRRVQLLKALELLQQHDMHIGQVADRAGFQHPCNFSTAFKQEFGCSPKELRRALGTFALGSGSRGI